MQIVAAEPAGHVQRFADDKKARLFFHGKGFRIELARVHTAAAHFRLVHAFAAADGNGLMLQGVHDVAQGGIAVSMQIAIAVRFCEVVSDGFRQVRAQGVREVVLRMGAFAGKQVVGGQVGQVVDEDGRVFLPVAGNLQHGGAADAAMGVEQVVTEAGRAGGCDADFVADANETDGRGRERKRHQGGTEGIVADAVLFGDAQGVVAGAQFGIAWPAAGDDKLRCVEIAVAGFNAVAVAVVVLAVDGDVVV